MTTVTHAHPAGQPVEPGPADPGTDGQWPPVVYEQFPTPPPRGLAKLFHLIATKPAWLAPAALLACFGMSVLYVEKFDPTTGEVGPTGGCAFKAITGLDCPGCGGTRAFFYLIHGNLPEAARNHALAVFAAPFVVYMYIAWSVNRIFHTKIPMLRITPTAISVFLGAWLAFAVLRDLPWAPFTRLFV